MIDSLLQWLQIGFIADISRYAFPCQFGSRIESNDCLEIPYDTNERCATYK